MATRSHAQRFSVEKGDDEWCTRGGKQEAQQLFEFEKKIHSAKGHFDRGWYWLHMGQYNRALFELTKALSLYDRTTPMVVAEVSVERQQDFLEKKAKCHCALGQVMMATLQMDKAEEALYRAWRISTNYEEMKSMSTHAEHLMEEALSHKWGSIKAHYRITCIKNSIRHEISADCMYANGSLRMALEEYRKCLVREQEEEEEEEESYLCIAQAHVRCKLAMLYQALGMLEGASKEWAIALQIYQHELGSEHSRTLATKKRLEDSRHHHYSQQSRKCKS